MVTRLAYSVGALRAAVTIQGAIFGGISAAGALAILVVRAPDPSSLLERVAITRRTNHERQVSCNLIC